jgi:hypothetical protein
MALNALEHDASHIQNVTCCLYKSEAIKRLQRAAADSKHRSISVIMCKETSWVAGGVAVAFIIIILSGLRVRLHTITRLPFSLCV